MAEYGLPALAGGRLRSTFSKPHGRRNPAYLLLGYRNTMPARLPNADKIEARDTGRFASSHILTHKQKFIPRCLAMKLSMEDPGIWREIGQYLLLVAWPNQPSLPKPTGIRHWHYRLLANQFHMVASCFHRAPLYASCGEARGDSIVIHSPTTRLQRVGPAVCIGISSNRLG